MSKSHIDKLKSELEKSKWIIHTDISTNEFLDTWEISKPNGDFPLKINFFIGGNGKFGACIGDESMNNAIGCNIEEHSEIDIYFGKYLGQFQKDIIQFISKLNKLK